MTATARPLRLVGPPPSEPDPDATATALAGLYDHICQAVRILNSLPAEPLRLSALRSALNQAHSDALDAMHAAELLAEGAPLADVFPDGRPRPDAMTPRQVLYLVDFALDGPERARRAAEAAEQRARHAEAIARHNAAHGFHEPRKCAETTRAGAPCKGSALPFLEHAICHPHASEADRAANAAADKAYWSTFPEQA